MVAGSLTLLFWLVVGFICLALGVLSSFRQRRHKFTRALKAVSRQFGGRFVRDGLWQRPHVRFRYGATHVLVDVPSGSSAPRLRVRINLLYSDFRCDIWPAGAESLLGMDASLQELQIATELDNRYRARSNNLTEMRRFVSPGVRLQLARLIGLFHAADVFVSVDRSLLTIKKVTLRAEPAGILQVVRLALDLHDQIQLTRTTGIEFVRETAMQPIAAAVCQVCGEALGADIVLCRRCQTPHHLDCWCYFGGCSIYGCAEPDYVKPKVARLASQEKSNDRNAK